MYNNISSHFNNRPKFYAKIVCIYSVVSLAFLALSLVRYIVEFSISSIISNVVGIAIHAALLLYFGKAYAAQTSLKGAMIEKNLKKAHGLTDAQIPATLAEIDQEMANAVYTDYCKNEPFVLTENWLVGSFGYFERATAIRLDSIKELTNLNYRYRNTTTYQIIVTTKNDQQFRFLFCNESKRDEASVELNIQLKNITQ